MKNQNKLIQTLFAQRDGKIAGGSITETNGNVFIGIFLLLIIASAGLAWAFTIGLNQGGQTPQTEHKSGQILQNQHKSVSKKD